MPAQTKPTEILSIIEAIENASAKELDVLTDIHRAIVSRSPTGRSNDVKLQKSNASIIAQITRRQEPANDSYPTHGRNQLHDIRNSNGRVELSVSGERFQIGDNKNQKSSFIGNFPPKNVAIDKSHATGSKLQSIDMLSHAHDGNRPSELAGGPINASENIYSAIGNTARKLHLLDDGDASKQQAIQRSE